MQDKVMSILEQFAENNGYEYKKMKGLCVNPWCYVKRIGRNVVILWFYDGEAIVCKFRSKVGERVFSDGYFRRITDFNEQGVLEVLKECLNKSVVNAFKEVLYNR